MSTLSVCITHYLLRSFLYIDIGTFYVFGSLYIDLKVFRDEESPSLIGPLSFSPRRSQQLLEGPTRPTTNVSTEVNHF